MVRETKSIYCGKELFATTASTVGRYSKCSGPVLASFLNVDIPLILILQQLVLVAVVSVVSGNFELVRGIHVAVDWSLVSRLSEEWLGFSWQEGAIDHLIHTCSKNDSSKATASTSRCSEVRFPQERCHLCFGIMAWEASKTTCEAVLQALPQQLEYEIFGHLV